MMSNAGAGREASSRHDRNATSHDATEALGLHGKTDTLSSTLRVVQLFRSFAS
jgi:hypothetical protein